MDRDDDNSFSGDTQVAAAAAAATKPSSSQQASSSPSFLLQGWHVVLGDPQASYRSTAATDLLRAVKKEFKQARRGQGVAQWINSAIETFQRRVKAKFSSKTVADDEIGRVLIKCNAKTLASGRVDQANICRFAGDTADTYGTAHADAALAFFFYSRDAPTLAQELHKYQKRLQRLLSSQNAAARGNSTSNHHHAVRSFVKTILFFRERLQASQRGDVLAKALLQSLSVIPTLRAQWNLLENKMTTDKATVHEQAVIPWDCLYLQLVPTTATSKGRRPAAVAVAMAQSPRHGAAKPAPSQWRGPQPSFYKVKNDHLDHQHRHYDNDNNAEESLGLAHFTTTIVPTPLDISSTGDVMVHHNPQSAITDRPVPYHPYPAMAVRKTGDTAATSIHEDDETYTI